MTNFRIDFYKTDDLSPDEANAKRRNARGVWLHAGDVEAPDERKALTIARRLAGRGQLLGGGCKLRINRN